MSEPITPTPSATGEPGTQNPPTTEPNVSELQNSLSASRRREKETQDKLIANQKQLDELLKDKEDRDAANLSEVDKLKKANEDLTAKNKVLNGTKESWDNHIKTQEELCTKAIEESKISEADQVWINKVPIELRMQAITSYSGGGITPPGGMPTTQNSTLEQRILNAKTPAEIQALKLELANQ